MNCGNNCGCSITYEELLQYLDSYIANALLCGKLQGGLNACESTTILPQGTGVVTCSQLKDLINDLIKDGEINIPGIEELKLDGTHLKLTDQAGKTWDVDLDGLLDRTVKDFKLTSEGQILLTLKDGTEFPIDLAGYVAGKVSGARWNSALINSEGKLIFSATDGTTLEVDLSGYVQSETKKANITGATVGADGKVTLTKGDGTTVEFDIATYVDSQMQTLKNGNIVSGKLDADRNLMLTRADGTTITVDMDPLKKVYVERDSALTGDGTEENPLDIDFSRVCWEIFESVHFTDQGLVIQTNTQCDPVVVPLSEFLAILNNKITVCVSDQGIITGTGKEGNCLGIDLQKLAKLLTGDADAWTVIMNAINNSLNVSHDQTLKGSGKPDDKLGVRLSSGAGNLLEVRDDGLYYGQEAPADVSKLYVSSTLGNDANPGTREQPLKTLGEAMRRYKNSPVTYSLYLRAGETFNVDRGWSYNLATLVINPYDFPNEKVFLQRICPYYEPIAAVDFPQPVLVFHHQANNTTPPIDHQYFSINFSTIRMYGVHCTLQPLSLSRGDTFNSWGLLTGDSVQAQWCWIDSSASATKPRWFESPTVNLAGGKYDVGSDDGTNGWLVSSDHGSVIGYTQYIGQPAGCPGIGAPAYTAQPSAWKETVGKLTPANLCFDARYDKSTKRYFSAFPSWDIFA